MANKSNSVLYTGITSDLLKRVYEHKKLIGSEFTSKYKCIKLEFFKKLAICIMSLSLKRR
jgi:putative endonuclease